MMCNSVTYIQDKPFYELLDPHSHSHPPPRVQVKIWFQNRRMKWRNSKERELLSTGGCRQQTLPAKTNPHPDLTDVGGGGGDYCRGRGLEEVEEELGEQHLRQLTQHSSHRRGGTGSEGLHPGGPPRLSSPSDCSKPSDLSGSDEEITVS